MTRWLLITLLLLSPTKAAALEGLRLGDAAPAFSLPELSGAVHSLDALGARPRLVVFWSTWSPRSLELLEDLRARHERWTAAGLAVLAVNADGERLDESRLRAVRSCVERLGLPFPVVFDGELRTYAAYGVMALPSAVLVDAGGRIAYALGGYPETLREEMKEQVEVALGGPRAPEGGAVVAARRAEAAAPAQLAAQSTADRCTLPRAFYCALAAERHLAGDEPAIVAVRLAICRGNTEEAQKMLLGVGGDASRRVEFEFALGSLLLLEGRMAEAGQVFDALRKSHPAEGWGDWGLGMAALAAGDPDVALRHMQAAAAARRSLPEAETAVLKYLEEHWRSRREAPREEQFLALFQELEGVRACYRRNGARG